MANSNFRALGVDQLDGVQSVRNYIKNGAATKNTVGWATYADAAGTAPVDGTGGSPASTLTRSTTSPLTQDASFVWTKSAADRQGEGFSYDFTIDSAMQGQQLAINYLLGVDSGTFVTGDMTVWIYDVTNAIMIQPSAYQVVSTGIAGPAQPAVFQAASNSTSYRLIFHTSTTSALAYTLKLDNISVISQVVPAGMVATDWVSYTPVLTSSGGGAVTLNGTSSIAPWGRWRRVGDSIQIFTGFRNGTGAAASGSAGILKLSTPSGIVRDTTNPSSESDAVLGAYLGSANSSTANVAMGTYDIFTDGTVGFSDNTGGVVNVSDIVAGYSLNSFAQYKVVGWSSNTLVSDSAASRPVVFSGTNSAGTSIANTGETIVPFVATRDSLGCWNGTDTYTVKVPGDYRFSATLYFQTATYAALTAIYAAMYRNGVAVSYGKIEITQIATGQWGCSIVCLAENCVAGDTLQLYVANNRAAGATSLVTVDIVNHLEIEMIQGPTQIQAATVVAARAYRSASTQTIPTSTDTTLIFDIKSHDATGSYDNTTGIFTAPAPGIYSFRAAVKLDFGGINTFYIYAQKNGTGLYSQSFEHTPGASDDVTAIIADDIQLNANDTLQFKVAQFSGGPVNTANIASQTFFSIHRVSGVN